MTTADMPTLLSAVAYSKCRASMPCVPWLIKTICVEEGTSNSQILISVGLQFHLGVPSPLHVTLGIVEIRELESAACDANALIKMLAPKKVLPNKLSARTVIPIIRLD